MLMFYLIKRRKSEILHRQTLNVFKWGAASALMPTTAHHNERDSIACSFPHYQHPYLCTYFG